MTTDLIFTKMQGLGNDYIYFDCTETPFPNPESAAVKLSHRQFGIGGDGIILIKKSDVADFQMTMFNADGSEGKMCGNGIRCVGKYVYEKGLTEKEELQIETRAGIRQLKLFVKDKLVSSVSVDMGKPIFNGPKIPTSFPDLKVLNKSIFIEDKEYFFSSVSMGNPHCVIFTDEITDSLVYEVGPIIEKHQYFPERVNVEFVVVNSRSDLTMRVWERGSGETFACGTGASAVTVVAYELGLIDRNVTIHLLGGDLNISYLEDSSVIKQGPAEFVFEGTVPVTW